MSIPINIVAGPDYSNPAIHYLNTHHDIDVGSGKLLRFAIDFLGIQFPGDCHTHTDALCHIAYKEYLYNGRLDETLTSRGAPGLDFTAYAHGTIGREVLVDVPRHQGVKWLEPGEAVKREEIEAIECAENVRLSGGGIMLFRTGRHHRRLEIGAWDIGYSGQGRAGLDPYCLSLVHERKVAVFLLTAMAKLFRGLWRRSHTRSIHSRSQLWAWRLQITYNSRNLPKSVSKKDGGNLW